MLREECQALDSAEGALGRAGVQSFALEALLADLQAWP